MSSITAYILDDDNYLRTTRSGDVETVLLAIEIEQTNYTLQPPPDDDNKWRWVEDKWVKVDTAE